MKILIVEDSNEKIERVISKICSGGGIERDDIEVAYTSFDARKMLRDTIFDLMILDILVPMRAGDPPRSENPTDLLVELRDRRFLKKPRHIIGLTAYDAGYQALQPIFAQQTWAIIKYDNASAAWADQLVHAISWIKEGDSQQHRLAYGTDVFLISALDLPEYDAIVRNGWDWSAPTPIDETIFIRRAVFECSDVAFNAVSAYCPKMGMVPAALVTAKVIAAMRPRIVAMCGICAGIKDRTNYGDPVVADPCWDWQRGKHVFKNGAQEFEMRPDQLPLAQELRTKLEQLKNDKALWAELKDGWPGAPDTDIRLRLGPSVSGSSVLADSHVVDSVKHQHGGLMSIDMEAYGVLAATSFAGSPRPIAFSCKSVCDFADDKKDDRWQTYASYTSARAVTKFFERYMIDFT